MSYPDYRIRKSTGETRVSLSLFRSMKFAAVCKHLGLNTADIREAEES